MRWFLFLGRVAFICNLFFIVCLLVRHTHVAIPEAIDGFVIIVGWVLSVILNVVTHLLLVVLIFQKQRPDKLIWLHIFNALCFFFQIVYFLF